MSRTFFVAALAAILAGCGGDTGLLLDLSLASGFAQPASLRVTVYAQGVLGAPQTMPLASAGRALPGRLVVKPLDASLPDPRLLVDGLDDHGTMFAQAAARVQLAAGRQTEVALLLDHRLADSDGDGVPDSIDDCPALYDPDQRCGAPGSDGAPADLAVATDGPPGDLGRGPPCPTPNLFCDDFETGDTSKWMGTSSKFNTVIAVDGTQPWGGQFSLDVSAQANPQDGGGFASESASVDNPIQVLGLNTLAARLYVRTPSPPGSFAMFLGLFAGSSQGYAVGSDSLGNWVVTQDQGMLPDQNTTVAVPIDRWVCVEFILDPPDVNHPAGRARLLTDGTTIADFAPAGYVSPTLLDVGLVRAPGTQSSQVRIDDVALAAQPIGCE